MKNACADVGLFLVAIVCLAGCAATYGSRASAAGNGADANGVVHIETRLSAGDESNCIIAKDQAKETPGAALVAIGSVLLPKAIDGALSALSAYLKETASSTSSKPDVLSSVTYMYRLKAANTEPYLRCITIARGKFGAIVKDFDDVDAGLAGKFDANFFRETGLEETPDFYAEFVLRYSTQRNAFMIVPAYVYYGSSAAKQVGDGIKDLEFVFALSVPGQQAKNDAVQSSAFAVAPVTIRDAQIGGEVPPAKLAASASLWMVTPSPNESKVNAGQSTAPTTPVNMIVTFREADDPIAALNFLGNLIDENHNAISKGVSDGAIDALKKALQSSGVSN